MTRYLLAFLILMTLFSPVLGLDLSLAPGLSMKNAVLYGVTLYVLIESAVARNRRFQMLPVIVPLFLLVAYAFLTWFFLVFVLDEPGYRPVPTFISLKSNLADYFLIFLAFFYGLPRLDNSVWLVRFILWAVIAGNILTVVDGLNIPDLGLIGEDADGRVVGPIGGEFGSNEYGALVAFFLPTGIALYVTSRGILRFMALIGIFSSLLALLMTVSRGAYVGVIGGTIIGAIYLHKYITQRILARAIAALGVAIIIAFTVIFTTDFGDLVADRFATADSRYMHQVSSGRTVIWSTAIEHMLKHPHTLITGFGWQAYDYMRFQYATHSTYLNLLFNLGMIGLSLFLVTTVNVIRAARAALVSARLEEFPYLATLVFGMFNLLVTITFGDLYSPWIFVWAFCGVALRVAVEARSTAVEQKPRSVVAAAGEGGDSKGLTF